MNIKNIFTAAILIAACIFATTAAAQLYLDDQYDNSRYKNDFKTDDDLVAHASGVACTSRSEGAVILVDPAYNRLVWHYCDSNNKDMGARASHENFSYPQSIAISHGGEVYIADVGNFRIVKMQADYSNGLNLNYVKSFGRVGKGSGQFLNPLCVGIKEMGGFTSSVFVSDWSNHNVQEFDANGNYKETIGSYGTGPGQFANPRGMVSDGINLYIVDTGNGRIQRFIPYSQGYQFDRQVICGNGNPISRDARLTNIAKSNSGAIYAVDERYNKIYLFDEGLNYISEFSGDPGSPFQGLQAICVIPPVPNQPFSSQVITVEKSRIQTYLLGMSIENFRAEPAEINPIEPSKSTTHLKYVLTEFGDARVNIFDANNNIVKHLDSVFSNFGQNQCSWNGTDDNGRVLPSGNYLIEIFAMDRNALEGYPIRTDNKYCFVSIYQTPVITIQGITPGVIHIGANATVAYSVSKPSTIFASVMQGGTTIKIINPDSSGAVKWDGTNSQGTAAPDGFYQISVYGQDAQGYRGEAKTIQVALASTPPALALNLPVNGAFGLNASINGSVNGFLLASYKVEYESAGTTTWSTLLDATIDGKGNSVAGVGGNLVRWNTALLPPSETNRYNVRLTAYNQAGVENMATLGNILVDNIPPRLDALSTYPDFISPSPAATGSTQTTCSVTYQIVEGNTLACRIEFYDKYAAKRFETNLANLTGSYIWDGTDGHGVVPDDGPVRCRLVVDDKGGNESARECQVVIDTNRYPENIAVASSSTITAAIANNYRVAWAPNGKQIVYSKQIGSYTDVWLQNISGGQAVNLTNFSPATFPISSGMRPDLSPTGTKLLYDSTDNGSLNIKDLLTNQTIKLTAGFYGRWSPDGSKIAYMITVNNPTSSTSYVYVCNPDGSAIKQLATGSFQSWTPDSKYIAYSTGDFFPGNISLISPDGLKTVGPLAYGTTPEYSPDGNLLIYRNEQLSFSVQNLQQQSQILIPYTQPQLWQAAWSPDGNRVAFINLASQTFIANIARPDQYANLTAILQVPELGSTGINGSAADLNFAGYNLYYGHAPAANTPPISWTLFKSSQTEIKNGSLGDWNTTGLSGEYWLRLYAWDKAMNVKDVFKKVDLGILGPNLIFDVHADPAVIYPDIPGRNTATVYYTLQGALSSSVSISLINSSGQIVRSWNSLPNAGPFPRTYGVPWDGKNNSGVQVTEDRYTIHLTAVGGGTNIIKDGIVDVALGMPTSLISYPINASFTLPQINFIGSAGGPAFIHYWLEIGKGNNPSAWSLAAESDLSVANGILGQWTASEDGVFSARLRVHNTFGNEATTTILFNSDGTPPVSSAIISIGKHGTPYLGLDGKSYIGSNGGGLSIISIDEGSGVKEVHYRIDGNEQIYKMVVPISGAGQHLIEYFGIDQAGNTEAARSMTVVVNTLAPVTSITLGLPQCQLGGIQFISGTTPITLSATEQGSTAVPVTGTAWLLSNAGVQGQIHAYSSPFTLEGYANTLVSFGFSSTDAVNNSETINWKDLYVDVSPPVTSLQINGPAPLLDPSGKRFATSATMLTFNSLDEGSQVDRIEYQKDSDMVWSGYMPTSKIILTAEGDHEIRYCALDHVGNSETANSYRITIDNTAPKILVIGVLEGGVYAPSVTPGVEISDLHLKESQILLDGQAYLAGTPILDVGLHLLNISAVDWARNSKYAQMSFTVAVPTPTITLTPTATATSTPTPTATTTPSFSVTATPSSTRSPSQTTTPTNTITATPSNTSSPSQTTTPTNTITPRSSSTPSPSQTTTPTNTITATPSNTSSPSQTATPTNTITPTSSSTPSPSQTATPTNTITPTPSSTFSPSASDTTTSTISATPSPRASHTSTLSETATSTRTQTPTISFTSTPTLSFTRSATPSTTPSSSFTITSTASGSATLTSTQTTTVSTTPTQRPSYTGTATSSPTPSSTKTISETATNSATRTPTFARSATPTKTPTMSRTCSPTVFWTCSFTSTRTKTTTPTFTKSATHTFSATPSITALATRTPTPTITATLKPSVTGTPLTPQQVKAWVDGCFIIKPGKSKQVYAISQYHHHPQPNITLRYRVLRGSGTFAGLKEKYAVTGPNGEPANVLFKASNEPSDANIIEVDNIHLGGQHCVLILVLPEHCWKHGKHEHDEDELVCGSSVDLSQELVFDDEENAMKKAQELIGVLKTQGQLVNEIGALCLNSPTATPTHTMLPTQIPSQTATFRAPSVAQFFAYPNPGKDKVTFAISAVSASTITIDIFSISGERIAHISEAGENINGMLCGVWKADTVGRGIYICRIAAKDSDNKVIYQKSLKIVLIR